MKNIIIVGFMGTGKTAVARALARELDMAYVSIDQEIESRERRPIKDIFRDNGEPYFRKVEKEIVKEISAKGAQVIDAGGGVVLDSENMENLRKGGVVVCLWATPETIHERTSRSKHRPLLNVEDPLGRIRELLGYRKPFYEKADFHVVTDGESVENVVRKVRKIIHGEGKTHSGK